MRDIALDRGFSVFLDDSGDLGTVSGQREFEQSVAILLTDHMWNSLSGEFDDAAIKQKLTLEATRVARKHDRLDSIRSIDVSSHPEEPQTYVVRIDYQSDDYFETLVTE